MTPWMGDACSLVDAYRAGERSPVEELDATFAAIDASTLNSFSFLDREAARETAASVDVSKPFGGVPVGVKELDRVAGWPYTEASVPLKDRVADRDATKVARLRDGGAVLVGLTTASEFGGVNLTRTALNGTTHNPWQMGRTPGGSSGGSAAAVAGGLVTLATAGDGGGSIRIPAGFCGLVGLKTTYGRIPKGPDAEIGGITAVPGCVSRSVRDTARWLDVCSGYSTHDPLSLPRVADWEANLGALGFGGLAGLRVAVLSDFGGGFVAPSCWALIEGAAHELIAAEDLSRIDVDPITWPSLGTAWSLAGLWAIYAALGDAWPACQEELTPEIRFGLNWAHGKYDMNARIELERRRTDLNETMADLFDQVDLVITASNPETAFAAEGPLPSVFEGTKVGTWNNGRLTIPANIYGNPSIQIPVGSIGGLPVGMQIMARHHQEAVLLELALSFERARPWPLVAPMAPV